jgi:DNA invertase Pin-like site-specific DNA recombinase
MLRDKQDNQNQLDQLRGFAASQGWRIKREYVDVATGKNSDREQFKALFKAASRREFELVLFWSLDRFSREGVLETLTYLQNLKHYGVGYRSFTEQYLDSCGMFREAVISILAVIAKQERVQLSERTIAGLQRARACDNRLTPSPQYTNSTTIHTGNGQGSPVSLSCNSTPDNRNSAILSLDQPQLPGFVSRLARLPVVRHHFTNNAG